MLLWPSTARLWREWAAPSSWVCTSQRTSPGLTTPHHWPRKHSSVSTSFLNWEEPEPWPSSCAPSTEAPSRALWLAASLCGMEPATYPAARAFNAKWEQLRRSLVSLSPPSRTFTAPVSSAKPSALRVIPPTRHAASLVCCHQGGDCPGQDQRTEGQLHPSGCQEAQLCPGSAPYHLLPLCALCHFKQIDKLFLHYSHYTVYALFVISLVCTLSAMCLVLLYLSFLHVPICIVVELYFILYFNLYLFVFLNSTVSV